MHHRDAILDPVDLTRPERFVTRLVRGNPLTVLRFAKEKPRVQLMTLTDGAWDSKDLRPADATVLRLAYNLPLNGLDPALTRRARPAVWSHLLPS